MGAYRRGRDEVKVGLFALAAVVVFVLMFGALTSRGMIRHTADLYVLLPSAEGLLKGDAVLYRGVPVGEVRAIDFLDDRGVLIRALLRRAVPLSVDAGAALEPVDMFGRQAIVLREARHDGGLQLASGDTLVGERSSRLSDRVEAMGARVERLISDTTLLLLQDALAGVGRAGRGIEGIGAEARGFLDSQERALEEVTTATARVARNLGAATDSAELMALRAELRAAVVSLARASARMDSASVSAASVFAKLDRGEGSLGLLLNDAGLYTRASEAVVGVEELVADVRRNPGRYITLKVF